MNNKYTKFFQSPLSKYYHSFKTENEEPTSAEPTEDKKEIEVEIEDFPYENISFPNPDLLKYYRDKDQRVIWLLTKITDDLYSIVDQIIEYNTEDKDIPPEERTPIRLMINSPGGYVDMTFVIAHFISISQTPIYGYALGNCSSGASIIYLACHKRFALPTTLFLFHKGSCDGIGGTYDQVQSAMKVYTVTVERMIKFYEEHTKFDPTYIAEKLHGSADWYFFSEDALQNGVTDELITDINLIIAPKI